MRAMLLFVGLALAAGPSCAGDDARRADREAMVRAIERDTADTALYTDREDLDPRVMDAMRLVPRHEFVPRYLRSKAYENRPLPIGHGQTISQPFIVALMTDLLRPEPDHVVLEVGTGSGYQAAVLSPLVSQVYTMEIIPALGESAAERFEELGYANIEAKVGDGYYGWEAHAPFDAIIVTAAAGHVPPPLIAQLKPGGRMVIPVGSAFMTQQLMLVEKDPDGSVSTRQMLPVAFVPLTGGH